MCRLHERRAAVTPVGVDGSDAEAFGRGDEGGTSGELRCDGRSDYATGQDASGIWRDLAGGKRKTEVGPLLAPVIAAGQKFAGSDAGDRAARRK